MTSPFPTADEHATTAAPGGAVVGRHRPRLAVDVDAANNSSPPPNSTTIMLLAARLPGVCVDIPTCAARV